MQCTRLSSLQNLTPRTPEQWDGFMKRRGQDLRRNEEVVDALDSALANGDDIAWEWPSSADAVWSSKAIKKLVKRMRHYGRCVHWCRFDGCCYGLQWRGLPLRQGWTVLTTSREPWMSLCKKMPWIAPTCRMSRTCSSSKCLLSACDVQSGGEGI